MEGLVNIQDFMEHLQRNNLVIAPAKMVKKDVTGLRKKVLRKNMLTLNDITEAELWGNITRKRVYQIAKDNQEDAGVISVGGVTKLTKSFVERVARMRGVNLEMV